MMVLLVVGCTVEVVDTDKVVEAFSTDEENINSDIEVVGTGEVDVINGRDIIDEVVNTVDVSDTDDE